MNHEHHQHGEEKMNGACCAPKHRKDWFLWALTGVLAASLFAQLFFGDGLAGVPYLPTFTHSVTTLLQTMWWGVLLGIFFVGVLAGIPQELVVSVLGKGGTLKGILRATLGGILLDLCSHGILLVGMQLYKRGASLGQVMAFLIASPWNSISLTLILWSLVGFWWMITVLLLSIVIAVISGLIFEQLVRNNILPKNPFTNAHIGEDEKPLRHHLHLYVRSLHWNPLRVPDLLWKGLRESQMILRWIFFGIVLASLIRTFLSIELFNAVFGPTLLGLGATLLFATILEVCSEGSMPVATDFLLRAKAPGNMFAFLMTGISTDYTEILSLKETTGRWKIAFFLPLVTVPQVVLIALILNAIPV